VHKDCSVEDMASLGWMVGGNAWRWRIRLLAWEEESVRECSALLVNIVLQDNLQDSWRGFLILVMAIRFTERIVISQLMMNRCLLVFITMYGIS
jgi:hypothetical protein